MKKLIAIVSSLIVLVPYTANSNDQNVEVISSPPNVICTVPSGPLGPIGNLCMLRAQLDQLKGATVKINGIDQTEVIKIISDAIFDIERRLEAIEVKK